jgi:hypothetical protein
MLFMEIILAYFDNRTKYIGALCGQNAKLLNVKASGKYSYHCALKG